LSLTTVLQIGLAPMAVTLGAIALAGGAVVAMWSAWNTQIVKTNERGSGAVGGAMQEMLEDMRQSGADAPKLADEFIAAYGRMNEQIANAGVAGAFVDRIGLAQQSLAALSGEISKSGAGYSTYITQMERAAQGAGLFTQRTENGLRVYQRSAGRIIEMSDAIGVLTREQFGNIQAQQETQRATALAADAQRYAAQAAQDLGQAYQEQSNWAGEVKTKFDALKDAQLKLNEAQASFSQNYADKVVSKLEAAGIKGEDLARALGALDDKMGTNTLATYEANKALDEAIKNYGKTKNLEDFDKALEANKSAWEKLDERLQQAKSGFEEAQTAFNNFIARIQEANGMEVTIYVNSLMKGGSQTKSSKRWGGDVTDLDDTRAAGGPTLAGRPYLVGEEGPEMFMPRTSGTVVNARQTQQLIEALMTGGGRGAPAQVVFQRGSIVAASNMSTRDLAVAVINEIRRM
jgi:tetratricopeptide (TPR) repeat protein